METSIYHQPNSGGKIKTAKQTKRANSQTDRELDRQMRQMKRGSDQKAALKKARRNEIVRIAIPREASGCNAIQR